MMANLRLVKESKVIRTKMSVQGLAQIDVELRCGEVGCQGGFKNTKTVPITFHYNATSQRFEPDVEEQKQLQESAMPEGWTSRHRSEMFSGEGHFTEWTEHYCPECSSKLDNA